MHKRGANTENQVRSGSNEESVNFKLSPNSNMKKHWLSKFEETNQYQPAIAKVNVQGASDSASSGYDEEGKVNQTAVQPPLPPYSPPPDITPITNLKKEIRDEEYQCNTTKNPFDSIRTVDVMTDAIETNKSEEKINTVKLEKKPRIMCRDFVRGACKKGASCRYVHEIIRPQLRGLYIFCKDFQNTLKCKYKSCRYVHATSYEEQMFYRTCYLPPHTLYRNRNMRLIYGFLPPPHLSVKMQQDYYNTTQPAIPQHSQPLYASNFDATYPGTTPIASPNREWNNNYATPGNHESSAPPTKECKSDVKNFDADYPGTRFWQTPTASPNREWNNNEVGNNATPLDHESSAPPTKQYKSCVKNFDAAYPGTTFWQSPTASPNREWNNNGVSNYATPVNHESSVPPTKRGQSCDNRMFSTEFSEARLKMLASINSNLQQDIATIHNKHVKLMIILSAVNNRIKADKGSHDGVNDEIKKFLDIMLSEPNTDAEEAEE